MAMVCLVDDDIWELPYYFPNPYQNGKDLGNSKQILRPPKIRPPKSKKIPKIPQNVFPSKTNPTMTLEHRQVTKHRVTCLSPYHEIAESTFVF